eukprot:m.296271 g.296271  ORF g.296271 m.296271 type:complete len:429 (+) comp22976_c0_seq14:1634-2920(+)
MKQPLVRCQQPQSKLRAWGRRRSSLADASWSGAQSRAAQTPDRTKAPVAAIVAKVGPLGGGCCRCRCCYYLLLLVTANQTTHLLDLRRSFLMFRLGNWCRGQVYDSREQRHVSQHVRRKRARRAARARDKMNHQLPEPTWGSAWSRRPLACCAAGPTPCVGKVRRLGHGSQHIPHPLAKQWRVCPDFTHLPLACLVQSLHWLVGSVVIEPDWIGRSRTKHTQAKAAQRCQHALIETAAAAADHVLRSFIQQLLHALAHRILRRAFPDPSGWTEALRREQAPHNSAHQQQRVPHGLWQATVGAQNIFIQHNFQQLGGGSRICAQYRLHSVKEIRLLMETVPQQLRHQNAHVVPSVCLFLQFPISHLRRQVGVCLQDGCSSSSNGVLEFLAIPRQHKGPSRRHKSLLRARPRLCDWYGVISSVFRCCGVC